MSAELNPPQRAAVEHGKGPLLILAGAGSGKTRVITHRLAALVERDHVRPWRILAVTFTNKAAAEMRRRAAELLGEEGAKPIWIGTFHSICARLLRMHAVGAGLRNDFLIIDDSDQKRLMQRIMRDLEISDQIATPRSLLEGIDRAKNNAIAADEFVGGDFMGDLVGRAYVEYQRRLRAANTLDFGDLLLETLRVGQRDPEASHDLRTRWDHVLVDEFQDTNRVQYELVRMFSARTNNLVVVGDDDQSIYGWRGADPTNILHFEDDHPGCATVKLEQNYRSTQTVLDAANAVIAKNRKRKAKRLFTENGPGEPLLYYTAPDERREAEFIVRAIRTLEAHEGRAPADFAVFYRTHAQSRVLEEALRGAGIGYSVVGGTRFYDRAEIKDLLAYLRVLANPEDEVSLERIVNVPSRGIGDTTIDRLRSYARREQVSLWAAMRAAVGADGGGATRRDELEAGDELRLTSEPLGTATPADVAVGVGAAPRKKLAQFVELVEELRLEATASRDLAGLAARVLERSGYVERLEIEGTQASRERVENLREMVVSLGDYQRDVASGRAPSVAGGDGNGGDGRSGGGASGAGTTTAGTLVGYLERVSLVAPSDGQPKGVALMTVHAAKGLEFPVVFLTGLEEGTFPRVERGAPPEEMEEERRLAYVAITRARERLLLTNAAQRQRFGADQGIVALTPSLDERSVMALHESRFIGDIPAELITRPVPKVRSAAPPAAPAQRRQGPIVEDRGDGVTVEREVEESYEDAPRRRTGGRTGSDPRSDGRSEGDEGEATAASPTATTTYIDYDDGYDTGGFRNGQRVRHVSFGEGKVVGMTGSGNQLKLTVRFAKDPTTRTVMARFLEPA